MKQFTVGDKTYEVPAITVVTDDQGKSPVFEISEGEYSGVKFSIDDIHMDDKDESLMWYDLNVGDTFDPPRADINLKIKPIVDDFIIMVLHEQIEREKNGKQSDSVQRDSNA